MPKTLLFWVHATTGDSTHIKLNYKKLAIFLHLLRHYTVERTIPKLIYNTHAISYGKD